MDDILCYENYEKSTQNRMRDHHLFVYVEKNIYIFDNIDNKITMQNFQNMKTCMG